MATTSGAMLWGYCTDVCPNLVDRSLCRQVSVQPAAGNAGQICCQLYRGGNGRIYTLGTPATHPTHPPHSPLAVAAAHQDVRGVGGGGILCRNMHLTVCAAKRVWEGGWERMAVSAVRPVCMSRGLDKAGGKRR